MPCQHCVIRPQTIPCTFAGCNRKFSNHLWTHQTISSHPSAPETNNSNSDTASPSLVAGDFAGDAVWSSSVPEYLPRPPRQESDQYVRGMTIYHPTLTGAQQEPIVYSHFVRYSFQWSWKQPIPKFHSYPASDTSKNQLVSIWATLLLSPNVSWQHQWALWTLGHIVI